GRGATAPGPPPPQQGGGGGRGARGAQKPLGGIGGNHLRPHQQKHEPQGQRGGGSRQHRGEPRPPRRGRAALGNGGAQPGRSRIARQLGAQARAPHFVGVGGMGAAHFLV